MLSHAYRITRPARFQRSAPHRRRQGTHPCPWPRWSSRSHRSGCKERRQKNSSRSTHSFGFRNRLFRFFLLADTKTPPVRTDRGRKVTRYHLWFADPSREAALGSQGLQRGHGRTRPALLHGASGMPRATGIRDRTQWFRQAAPRCTSPRFPTVLHRPTALCA